MTAKLFVTLAQSESAAVLPAVDALADRLADEGKCPHCGLAFSDDAPPMCPRCGAPR
ncbi:MULTISPECIES: hypothetical protein [unclassified Haloarcula]|uniref:hypothetical protein n=1 Tax=unclassified Haloarcula TaxID=2624677 RepID=UPI00177FEB47|nr:MULTISPECIES: hypothetical protein [unclassified Haloarcula]